MESGKKRERDKGRDTEMRVTQRDMKGERGRDKDLQRERARQRGREIETEGE